MTRDDKQQATGHAYFLEIIQVKRSRDSNRFVAKLRKGPVAMYVLAFKRKGTRDCCPTIILLPSYSFQSPYSLCYLFVA